MSVRPFKPVVFQPQTYLSLQKGIHQVVNAVRPTLGPVPRVVAVEYTMRPHVAPELLDSGATIAQRIVQLPNGTHYRPIGKRDGSVKLLVRPNLRVIRRVNDEFRGDWINADSIDKSEDEIFALWNEAHPDDPVEV